MRRFTFAAVAAMFGLGYGGVAQAQNAPPPPQTAPPPQYAPPPNIPPPPPESFPSAPQGQGAPQGAYVPRRWAPPPPAEIDDWSPGDPVPVGYRPVSRRHKGLIIGGAITFGVSYSLSLLLAAAGDDAGDPLPALWAPVVGPFIQLGLDHQSSDGSFLLLDGLAQVTGASLFIAGMVFPSHFLLRNDLARDGSGIAVGPLLARRGGGVSFSGHF